MWQASGVAVSFFVGSGRVIFVGTGWGGFTLYSGQGHDQAISDACMLTHLHGFNEIWARGLGVC